jgi:hypothetical protein
MQIVFCRHGMPIWLVNRGVNRRTVGPEANETGLSERASVVV